MSTQMRVHVEKYRDGQWVFVCPPGSEMVPLKLDGEITLFPRDDWYDKDWQNYDTMTVLGGVGNYDGFKCIEIQQEPEELSHEMLVKKDYTNEYFHSVLLSAIEQHDWDHQVTKLLVPCVRGDGTPAENAVESHRNNENWQQRGYRQTSVAARECVPELFEMIERIKQVADTTSDKIRLVFYFC